MAAVYRIIYSTSFPAVFVLILGLTHHTSHIYAGLSYFAVDVAIA